LLKSMPRVIGIDPGTITVDICGLDEGRVFLDRSFPTEDALADPPALVGLIEAAAPLDLVVGPSGYGLPVTAARDLTDKDIRLAYLPDPSRGGIPGLRSLVRALGASSVPVVLSPGVVHLPSVPPHRKVNRVDMGTADKVCAVALAIHQQMERRRVEACDVSLILLELGGAFTAAVAVEDGRIVDGLGGTSGPLGLRGAGALDGEIACLAGAVTKRHLFGGGVGTIAGTPDAAPEALAAPTTVRGRMAWEAFVESAVKAVATLAVSAPRATEVLLSGRVAELDGVRQELSRRVAAALPGRTVHALLGLRGASKQAAQGAAMIADGLAGGRFASIVDRLGLRDACGTVLDHLYVIPAAAARAALNLDS
jgi:predicted butyrate kinase (DUF1464 family)